MACQVEAPQGKLQIHRGRTGQEIQQSRQRKKDLGTDPLNGAKLDIACVRWKVQVEHSDFLAHKKTSARLRP